MAFNVTVIFFQCWFTVFVPSLFLMKPYAWPLADDRWRSGKIFLMTFVFYRLFYNVSVGNIFRCNVSHWWYFYQPSNLCVLYENFVQNKYCTDHISSIVVQSHGLPNGSLHGYTIHRIWYLFLGVILRRGIVTEINSNMQHFCSCKIYTKI